MYGCGGFNASWKSGLLMPVVAMQRREYLVILRAGLFAARRTYVFSINATALFCRFQFLCRLFPFPNQRSMRSFLGLQFL
jgi:hypothetical protein